MLYWGIFSFFSYEDVCFLTERLQSLLLEHGIFIRIVGHSFDDFFQDEPSTENDVQVLTVLLSMILQ